MVVQTLTSSAWSRPSFLVPIFVFSSLECKVAKAGSRLRTSWSTAQTHEAHLQELRGLPLLVELLQQQQQDGLHCCSRMDALFCYRSMLHWVRSLTAATKKERKKAIKQASNRWWSCSSCGSRRCSSVLCSSSYKRSETWKLVLEKHHHHHHHHHFLGVKQNHNEVH